MLQRVPPMQRVGEETELNRNLQDEGVLQHGDHFEGHRQDKAGSSCFSYRGSWPSLLHCGLGVHLLTELLFTITVVIAEKLTGDYQLENSRQVASCPLVDNSTIGDSTLDNSSRPSYHGFARNRHNIEAHIEGHAVQVSQPQHKGGIGGGAEVTTQQLSDGLPYLKRRRNQGGGKPYSTVPTPDTTSREPDFDTQLRSRTACHCGHWLAAVAPAAANKVSSQESPNKLNSHPGIPSTVTQSPAVASSEFYHHHHQAYQTRSQPICMQPSHVSCLTAAAAGPAANLTPFIAGADAKIPVQFCRVFAMLPKLLRGGSRQVVASSDVSVVNGRNRAIPNTQAVDNDWLHNCATGLSPENPVTRVLSSSQATPPCPLPAVHCDSGSMLPSQQSPPHRARDALIINGQRNPGGRDDGLINDGLGVCTEEPSGAGEEKIITLLVALAAKTLWDPMRRLSLWVIRGLLARLSKSSTGLCVPYLRTDRRGCQAVSDIQQITVGAIDNKTPSAAGLLLGDPLGCDDATESSPHMLWISSLISIIEAWWEFAQVACSLSRSLVLSLDHFEATKSQAQVQEPRRSCRPPTQLSAANSINCDCHSYEGFYNLCEEVLSLSLALDDTDFKSHPQLIADCKATPTHRQASVENPYRNFEACWLDRSVVSAPPSSGHESLPSPTHATDEQSQLQPTRSPDNANTEEAVSACICCFCCQFAANAMAVFSHFALHSRFFQRLIVERTTITTRVESLSSLKRINQQQKSPASLIRLILYSLFSKRTAAEFKFRACAVTCLAQLVSVSSDKNFLKQCRSAIRYQTGLSTSRPIGFPWCQMQDEIHRFPCRLPSPKTPCSPESNICLGDPKVDRDLDGSGDDTHNKSHNTSGSNHRIGVQSSADSRVYEESTPNDTAGTTECCDVVECVAISFDQLYKLYLRYSGCIFQRVLVTVEKMQAQHDSKGNLSRCDQPSSTHKATMTAPSAQPETTSGANTDKQDLLATQAKRQEVNAAAPVENNRQQRTQEEAPAPFDFGSASLASTGLFGSNSCHDSAPPAARHSTPDCDANRCESETPGITFTTSVPSVTMRLHLVLSELAITLGVLLNGEPEIFKSKVQPHLQDPRAPLDVLILYVQYHEAANLLTWPLLKAVTRAVEMYIKASRIIVSTPYSSDGNTTVSCWRTSSQASGKASSDSAACESNTAASEAALVVNGLTHIEGGLQTSEPLTIEQSPASTNTPLEVPESLVARAKSRSPSRLSSNVDSSGSPIAVIRRRRGLGALFE